MRDGLELPVDTVSMANDADALFWTLRATGKGALFTRLQAGVQPASVRVTLNGQVWEFAVDSVTRSRTFPEAAVQVAGRSVTSAAGAPYEFEQNWAVDGATTAAQIAASANLLTGLDVVWGIADWPVPDRVFSHFGTPLSVVKRVADAAGAIVQSDRVGYTVRVLPRYPLLPNEWPVVAPDVQIALDALATESFDRADRPEYDGVYCLGQQQGAFAFVRLAGTSGANLHPLVTDLLLTDDAACGLRGQSILGASGEQQTHSITLPVLLGAGEPGVLDVGMLARIVEPGLTWYGIVRSVDVQAAMPEAWQTVRMERHTKLIGGTVATPPATATPLLFTGPIADQVIATGAAVSLALAPYWTLGVPPYAWSMRSGTLPAWLALNAATGLVSGTAPGAAVPATPLAFRATDAINSTADSNALNLSVVTAAGTWTQRASLFQWRLVASSANGVKLVAVIDPGQIYTSSDSGVTWTARDSSRPWEDVASSTDGVKLVAVVESGFIYTSTDSGVSWTPRDSSRVWQGIASSSDGTKLIASEFNGLLYTSVDSGVTWTPRHSTNFWRGVTSSSDGVKLAAVVETGNIHTSTDSGVNWTVRASPRDWKDIASSDNGNMLVATVNGGNIYTSTDSGITWIARDAVRSWFRVASSSDGVRLAAAVPGGLIYVSADSGVTWAAQESARIWSGIASSSDGLKLVASVEGGFIYTGVQ